MKKMLIMLMALMMIASSAFAEKITFIETATYHLGSGDSEITAHEGARKECIKKAAAAGGVYVETYSKEVMFELTAQETEMIAASVIKAVEIEGESGMSKDRMNYDITMECTLDTDDIWKALLMRKNNKQSEKQTTESTDVVIPAKEKIIQHCIVINCDDATYRQKVDVDAYGWWVQTESGEEILKSKDFARNTGFTRIESYILPFRNGYNPNDAYKRFLSPTDFIEVKAVRITDFGYEGLAPLDQKNYLYSKHSALRGIVISDEDGERMKQVIKNNSRFTVDHLMITCDRYGKGM